MSGLLLFLGLAVLSAAFLSYNHPVSRLFGLAGVLATTFMAGYLLTDAWWVGAVCAGSWLLLPWVEILLRVRKLRLPLRKALRQVAPPSREAFPQLAALSSSVEDSGFEHVADLGWEMDGYRQFLRLFAGADGREEAVITHVEQNQFGFHFASVTSRTGGGEVFTTWNCPVSSSLKTPPSVHVNRMAPEGSFATLVAGHQRFLAARGVERGAVQAVTADSVRDSVERDMASQIQHNLREGLLQPEGDAHGRYSWRGMMFLWMQCLRDVFRMS